MLKLSDMNEDQHRAYKLSLETRKNLLITGMGGTGKSEVLSKIISGLKAQGKRVKVTAFTGLAAQSIGGITLSKLLATGIAKRVEDMDRYFNKEKAEEQLKGVTDIIIDEVSMLSGDFLELMDNCLQKATGEWEPFGGIRIIFSGDFLQLPPIRSNKDSKFRYRWAFQHPLFEEVVPVILSQNMRQSDPEEMLALSDFRKGLITPRVEKFLNSSVSKEVNKPTELHPINKTVDEINASKLDKHPGEIIEYPTYTSPHSSKKDFLKAVPIGYSVKVKIGVPVLILVNDPQGRYVNGSQGIVEKCSERECYVRLRNDRRVRVERKTWNIEDPFGKLLGTVEGMPLQLGWATTIHRAQGMTLEAVQTDISSCWEPGQAYVAISRVKSLKNLSLIKPIKRIVVDREALGYWRKIEDAHRKQIKAIPRVDVSYLDSRRNTGYRSSALKDFILGFKNLFISPFLSRY